MKWAKMSSKPYIWSGHSLNKNYLVLLNALRQIVQVIIIKLPLFKVETINSYLTNYDVIKKWLGIYCGCSLGWKYALFVLLKSISLGKEEVTLVAKQPLLRDNISMLMVGMPVKVSILVKGFQTNCASNSLASFIQSKATNSYWQLIMIYRRHIINSQVKLSIY